MVPSQNEGVGGTSPPFSKLTCLKFVFLCRRQFVKYSPFLTLFWKLSWIVFVSLHIYTWNIKNYGELSVWQLAVDWRFASPSIPVLKPQSSMWCCLVVGPLRSTVIRFRWGHEEGAPTMGLVPLQGEEETRAFSPPSEDARRWPSANPE